MPLDFTGSLGLLANQTPSLDLVSGQLSLAQTFALALANGTGANQADRMFSDTRSINASSNDDLDLAGSLTDALGATLTFARVKLIAIRNKSAAQVLTIGNAASNQFASWLGAATQSLILRPGGVFLLYAPDATGYAVNAGTGDLLRIANAAGSAADYDIVIIGASA